MELIVILLFVAGIGYLLYKSNEPKQTSTPAPEASPEVAPVTAPIVEEPAKKKPAAKKTAAKKTTTTTRKPRTTKK